jgi:GH24 family phage-related lysozyme (muramidase)
MKKFYGDQTYWGIGIVEDIHDPAQQGRVRVRIYGLHTDDYNQLPTRLLPWSTVTVDATNAGTSGVGRSPTGLVRGSLVMGFFLDGKDKQDFIVTSVITASDAPTLVQGELQGHINSGFYGGSNPERLYNLLRDRFEVSEEVAAAVVGTLSHAIGDPTLENVDVEVESKYGIGLWNDDGQRGLEEFAQLRRLDYTEFQTQALYLTRSDSNWNTLSVNNSIIDAQTVEEASDAVVVNVLGMSPDSNRTERHRYVREALGAYGSASGTSEGTLFPERANPTEVVSGSVLASKEEIDQYLLDVDRRISEVVVSDTNTRPGQVAMGWESSSHFLISQSGVVQVGTLINQPVENLPDGAGATEDGDLVSINVLRPSQEILDQIKRWEGFRATAYPDADGMSIGYGTFIDTPEEQYLLNATITEAEAHDLFERDVDVVVADLRRLIRVPLTQSQFDALVSFRYNVRPSSVENSTLLSRLNVGDYNVQNEFLKFVNARNGDGELIRLEGLVRRRRLEADWFSRGNTATGSLTLRDHRSFTVGVRFEGGQSEDGSASVNSYTRAQWNAFETLVQAMLGRYPGISFVGLRDLDDTTDSPLFDVGTWVDTRFGRQRSVRPSAAAVTPDSSGVAGASSTSAGGSVGSSVQGEDTQSVTGSGSNTPGQEPAVRTDSPLEDVELDPSVIGDAVSDIINLRPRGQNPLPNIPNPFGNPIVGAVATAAALGISLDTLIGDWITQDEAESLIDVRLQQYYTKLDVDGLFQNYTNTTDLVNAYFKYSDTLDKVNDVTVTAPVDGHFLRRNSAGQWVNTFIDYADITGTPGSGDFVDLVSNQTVGGIKNFTGTLRAGGSRVLTVADEGSGNGLDADSLDGQQGAYYLDWNNFTNKPALYSTTNFNTDFANKSTSDLGEGTNLYFTNARANSAIDGRVTTAFVNALNVNADTLDGQHGAYYRNASNINAGTIADARLPSTIANKTLSGTTSLGTDNSSIIRLPSDRPWRFYWAGNGGADTTLVLRPESGGKRFVIRNQPDTIDAITFDPDNLRMFVNGGLVWHDGNDGSGSGLDADLLDGVQLSQIARTDVAETFNNNLTVVGDLTVSGAINFVNSNEVEIGDSIILLNADEAGDPTQDAGLEVERGTSPNVGIQWSESNDYWHVTTDGSTWNKLITAGDFGAGSGIDADLLDGQHGSYYRNASNLNAGTISDARLPSTMSGKTFSGDVTVNSSNRIVTEINGSNATDTILRIRNTNATAPSDYWDFRSKADNTFAIWGAGGERLTIGTNGDFTSTSSWNITGNLQQNGNNVWHAGNDGSGSGLDADLLDGQHGSFYQNASNINAGTLNNARLPSSIAVGGAVEAGVGSGSVAMTVNDGYGNANLAFNHRSGVPDANGNALRIETNVDAASWASMVFEGKDNVTAGVATTLDTLFAMGTGGNTSYKNINMTNNDLVNVTNLNGTAVSNYWHSGNDGSGSGLDADTLDGYQASDFALVGAGDAGSVGGLTASQFLRSDTNDTFTGGAISFGNSTRQMINLYSTSYGIGVQGSTAYFRSGGNFAFYTGGSHNNDALNAGGGTRAMHYTSNEFYVRDNKVWHAGNDGSGSTLDADTVDGLQASQLLRKDGVNNGYTNIIVNDSDFIIGDSTDPMTNFVWRDHSLNSLFIGTAYAQPITRYDLFTLDGSKYWHAGNDGSGSGLDADLLDGLQGSQFLRSDVNTTLNGNLTLARNSVYLYLTDTGIDSDDFVIHVNSDRFYILTTNENTSGWISPYPLILHNNGTYGELYGNRILTTADEGSGNGLDADTVDGLQASSFVQTANNTSLNSDTRNSRGPTRLYRSDSNSDFSVQTDWTGSRWRLRGFSSGDTYHAQCEVGYADNADTVDNLHASQFLRSDANDATSGSLDIQGMILRGYSSDETDITGLVPGTTFGNIIESGSSRHIVIGIRGNDTNDGFHVLDTGNNTTGPYTQSLLRVTGSSFTRLGNEIWHAGNDGSGSGLDADLLDGLQPSASATGNTIMSRNGSGDANVRYLFSSYLNMSHNASGSTNDTVFYSSGDDYIRKNNATGFRASLDVPTRTGGNASGTWGISITGNASTVDGLNPSVGIPAFNAHGNGNSFSPGTYLGLNAYYGSGAWRAKETQEGWYVLRNSGDGSGLDLYVQDGAVTAGSVVSFNAYSFRNGEIYSGASKYWHAGNDGSGSGLDADTVDGLHASQFLRETGFTRYTVPNNTQIGVTGSSNTLEIYQNTSGADAYIQFHISGDYAARLGIDGGINDLAYGGWSAGAVSHRVWHAGNDGSGSGLDADTVDGYDTNFGDVANTVAMRNGSGDIYARLFRSTYGDHSGIATSAGIVFRNSTTDNYLRTGTPAAFVTWLNAQTGVDADTVDGLHASNFARNNARTDGYLWIRRSSTGSAAYFTNQSTGHIVSFRSGASDGTEKAWIENNGHIKSNSDITAYASDIQLKENILEIDSALDKISQLRGVSYDWKDECESLGFQPYQKHEHGLIAQEVQKIIPDAVRPAPFDEKYLTVKYERVIPLLVEAVKEEKKKREALEDKVKKLEDMVQTLINTLEQ